jgi:hypothetical protein
MVNGQFISALTQNPHGLYWSDLLEAKRRLYVELLRRPVSEITQSDIDLIALLVRDPGIEKILSDAGIKPPSSSA